MPLVSDLDEARLVRSVNKLSLKNRKLKTPHKAQHPSASNVSTPAATTEFDDGSSTILAGNVTMRHQRTRKLFTPRVGFDLTSFDIDADGDLNGGAESTRVSNLLANERNNQRGFASDTLMTEDLTLYHSANESQVSHATESTRSSTTFVTAPQEPGSESFSRLQLSLTEDEDFAKRPQATPSTTRPPMVASAFFSIDRRRSHVPQSRNSVLVDESDGSDAKSDSGSSSESEKDFRHRLLTSRKKRQAGGVNSPPRRRSWLGRNEVILVTSESDGDTSVELEHIQIPSDEKVKQWVHVSPFSSPTAPKVLNFDDLSSSFSSQIPSECSLSQAPTRTSVPFDRSSADLLTEDETAEDGGTSIPYLRDSEEFMTEDDSRDHSTRSKNVLVQTSLLSESEGEEEEDGKLVESDRNETVVRDASVQVSLDDSTDSDEDCVTSPPKASRPKHKSPAFKSQPPPPSATRQQSPDSSLEESRFHNFLAEYRRKRAEAMRLEKTAEEEEECEGDSFIVDDDEDISYESEDSSQENDSEYNPENLSREDRSASDDDDDEDTSDDEELPSLVRTPKEEKKAKPSDKRVLPQSDLSPPERNKNALPARVTPWVDSRLVRASNKKYLSPEGEPLLSFLASLSLESPFTRCHPVASKFVANFRKHRDELTAMLYRLFNSEVFLSQLPQDMEITWSNDLTKTAGLCSSKTNLATKERYCSIRLSSKVLDTADRLRDTLIHEMCHAAAWIITGICDGHGRIFKDWGYTAKKRFPELPIITRCHTYVIRAKFTYKCVGCDNRVNRHSKSIDIEKKVCARCRGRFELVRNYRNSKGLLEPVEEGSSTAAKTPKKPNEFALFVKEKYKDVRTPGVKHGDAMKQLSKMFKGTKIFEDL